MRPHSYENHNFSILKNTTKIDCLWIYFLHFFPLYNKLVNNRINHLSCHCRFIYTIKHFNVNQLCPHHLTQIEERHSYSSTGRNNQIRFCFFLNSDCKKRIANQIFDITICWKITWIHLLILKKAPRIFFIKRYPETILILPKRFKHIQVRQMPS